MLPFFVINIFCRQKIGSSNKVGHLSPAKTELCYVFIYMYCMPQLTEIAIFNFYALFSPQHKNLNSEAMLD